MQIRERELQRKLQLRNAELQSTQEKAIGRILQEAKPIVQQTITERNCSVLLNGAAATAAARSPDPLSRSPEQAGHRYRPGRLVR